MSTDTGYVWLLLAGLAVVSFATRAICILPGSRFRLRPSLEQVLRFAPAAAIAAIVVPDIVRFDGTLTAWTVSPRLLAGIAGIVVAATTRNILLTIGVGMVVLWIA